MKFLGRRASCLRPEILILLLISTWLLLLVIYPSQVIEVWHAVKNVEFLKVRLTPTTPSLGSENGHASLRTPGKLEYVPKTTVNSLLRDRKSSVHAKDIRRYFSTKPTPTPRNPSPKIRSTTSGDLGSTRRTTQAKIIASSTIVLSNTSPASLYTNSSSTNVSNSNCDIPSLDPFDPSVMVFFQKSKPLVCKKVAPNLFVFRNYKYLWNETEAKEAKFSKETIFCRHRCALKRPGDFSALYTDWTGFEAKEGFSALCDATQIQCSDNTTFQSIKFDRSYLHIVPVNQTEKNKIGSNYNIAMIMIDALSRSNFVRQLPKTYGLLEKLGFVEFKKHVKVGDNTEPNLFAFLTGRPSNSKSLPNKKGPYDDWPMLLFYLRNLGYLTYMIEDWDVGSLFVQYGGKGFLKQPTSHYPRPFWLTMWKSSVHQNSSKFCYNDQPYHNISFEYLLDFFKAYPGSKKFSFTMLERLTHDYLNTGGSADEHYKQVIEQMQPYLNNTFLFVFSDHGIRYHAVRRTRIGRIESSLPFLGIVMPTAFQEQHVELANNLRSNSNAGITSVYDMHYTIRSIADNFGKGQARPADAIGVSFFDKHARNRTCADAGVPNAYCVCQKDMEVQTNLTWVKPAAQAMVDKMNSIVKPYTGCAHMTLKNITMVSVKVPSHDFQADQNTLKPGVNFRTAVLTVVVEPSDGVMEADVLYDLKTKKWQVDGSIARINKYGDQPRCIKDDLARMYCYCL